MSLSSMPFRLLLVAASVCLAAAVEPAKLRGQLAVVHQAAALQKSLGEILAAIDAADGDDYLSRRVQLIERALASSYQALAKNEFGRLAPRSVHYLVHHYFAKEHGWQIRGFEALHFSGDGGGSQNVSVLEDRLPAALEGLLEARRSHRGLALGDVVAMAALLERLIADQSIRLLVSAYEWHNFSTSELLERSQMQEVLRSVVVLLRNPEKVKEVDEILSLAIDEPIAEFQRDTLNNVLFEQRHRSNPFTTRQHSFQEASAVVARLTHQYGKWSNSECQAIKQDLMASSPGNTGLVPLSKFYEHDATSGFRFWESMPYLRQIGALEESNPRAPHVRIANYVAGPTNCIGHSSYYSVCCVDECKSIMSELEGAVQAPAAPVARLQHLVEGLSALRSEAPAELSADLKAKLQAIADHHGGTVPLHGRLFAQWLHLAFPSECSYPHVPTDGPSAPLTGDYISQQEMDAHVAAGRQPSLITEAPTASSWTDDEVLPLLERSPGSPSVPSWLRTGMLLLLLAAGLRAACSTLWGAASAVRGAGGTKGTLPMYA